MRGSDGNCIFALVIEEGASVYCDISVRKSVILYSRTSVCTYHDRAKIHSVNIITDRTRIVKDALAYCGVACGSTLSPIGLGTYYNSCVSEVLEGTVFDRYVVSFDEDSARTGIPYNDVIESESSAVAADIVNKNPLGQCRGVVIEVVCRQGSARRWRPSP